MTVFISHSFDNRPEFENVAEWLEQLGVPYWKPAEVKSGASLRGQLRQAVSSCSVCIFVATRQSVTSSWCGAELGAFWGIEIPIITYVAEATLPEDSLPPILQGDVWERKLSSVAKRAAELVRERSQSISPSDKVTSMTVEQLEKLVAGAVSLVRAGESRVGEVTSSRPAETTALDAAGHILRAAYVADRIARESDDEWRRRILWVDDRPSNNIYERGTFEALGLTFELALTTEQALDLFRRTKFSAVISDMGRREGPREGYRLLEEIRSFDTSTPFFIYAGSNSPEHRREADVHGAQGCTNSPGELVDMVTSTLLL